MNAPLTRFQPEGAAECRGCSAGASASACDCSNDVFDLINVGRSAIRVLKPGLDVFRQGQGAAEIHYLVDGWVALCDLLSDGRRQILQFALPGAFLGFHVDDGMMSLSAQTLSEVTVFTIPRAPFETLVRGYPELGMRLVGLIARDRSLLFDHITSIGRRTARERIARLLLELYARCRAQWPAPSTDAVHLPLTQEHIADATGLTGVHVNRVLSELRKDAVAKFHYRRLTVIDPERLIKIAGVDPKQLNLSTWAKAVEFCPCGKTACRVRRALAGPGQSCHC